MTTPRPQRSLCLLLLVGAAAWLASCSQVSVTAVEVAHVEVVPSAVELLPGENSQLTAQLTADDGSALSGREVSWSSINPEVAPVSSAGIVTAMAPGRTTIQASAEGVTGSAGVTVGPGPLIALDPESVSMSGTSASAEEATASVAITNGGGGTLGGLEVSITYRSDASGWLEASLGSTAAPTQLELTASASELDPGTYEAEAAVSSPDASDASRAVTVSFLVRSVPVASVEVVPEAVTLIVGETEELEARARDGEGTVLPGRAVEWSVDDLSVARVDPDGVVTAVGPGVVRVTATVEGVSGEGEVTVEPRPSIVLDPAEIDFRAVEGEEDPPPERVFVRNGGGGTLSDLSREVSYPKGEATGWLDATLRLSSSPPRLTLRADIGSLREGRYRASVIVRSSVAENSPQEVEVELSVAEPPPRIEVSSTEVFMSGTERAREPAVVEVGVSNGGGGTLDGLGVVGLSYEEGQPTGWLEAAFESPTAPTFLELRAHSRRLDPGEYGATVTISAPDASNAPVTIDVSFDVSP